MAVNGVSSNTANSATEKGTPIIKPGSEMDKNAFLKILAAELTNQDPMNAGDSSQYVAQMAQFTSLEQMANLNSTMTMSAANSLIGKGVALNAVDNMGNQYSGIVRSVMNRSGNIKLTVEVNENGSNVYKEFNYSDVTDILNVPDYDMQNLSKNMLMLTTAAMIGKKAEFSDKDANGNNYVGTIKGVFIDSNNNINFNVLLDGTGETKDLAYAKLIKVKEA